MTKWAVYIKEHLVYIDEMDEMGEIATIGVWVKEYNMYSDRLAIDSWQLKEVSGKRKQAIFLGHTYSDFPFVYPVELTNGLIIEQL